MKLYKNYGKIATQTMRYKSELYNYLQSILECRQITEYADLLPDEQAHVAWLAVKADMVDSYELFTEHLDLPNLITAYHFGTAPVDKTGEPMEDLMQFINSLIIDYPPIILEIDEIIEDLYKEIYDVPLNEHYLADQHDRYLDVKNILPS